MLLALGSLLGCVGLAHPDLADVARAQALYPQADLATLEAGRKAYVSRCAGCHALFLPRSRGPAEWPKRVAEMDKDAKLLPGERELITQFLVTLSSRDRQP